MLETCALGHDKVPGTHNWIINYEGRTAYLPKGQHSRQRSGRGEIQVRFVKSLCRHFGILDCAARELPQLQ